MSSQQQTSTAPGGAPRAVMPMARVEGVTKVYGQEGNEVHAIREADLEIAPGEFVAVMGPSGSGKSTLMHLIAGLETPSTGRIWIGEQEVTHLDDAALTELRRRRVGFVFQSFNLMPTMDVRENILLPFHLDGRKPSAEESAGIEDLLHRLGLENRLSHRPGELSGGQQQRVAIARALATRPDLILADEPTGNLDTRSALEVLQLLRMASQELGQSIVMVTHDPKAAAHAHRVLYLADGRIVHQTDSSARAEDIASTMLSLEVG